jgi:hypothetical protein
MTRIMNIDLVSKTMSSVFLNLHLKG